MIRFFVDHPVVTWMIFAVTIVCGVYALPRLNIEAMPAAELPSLSVRTDWSGASPRAVQRSITVPIEEAARNVHGIETITSRSAPGRSTVEIEFRRDIDIEFARLQLSEQLGAVRRRLPATASPSVIVPFIPEEFRTDDFFSLNLVSPLSPNELREEAETWLVPRLLSVPGVANVELQGGALPIIKIYLDLGSVERHGLTADAIAERIASLDDVVPAGAIRRGRQELTVCVRSAVSIESLRETIVTMRGAQPVTLARVARVEEDFEDPAYFVRIGGENVVQAVIAKQSGENSVAVSRNLRAALPGLEADLPFPVSFEIDEDQGRDLEDKLYELVYRSLIILALLFVLLALALRQVRLTVTVVVSILLAIVICLSLYYFLGISVNFITISGLTVCFGMLLDNSILVLDATHRFLGRGGPGAARRAVIDGAREVAFPILATTFTTVVAFLSFIFLSGRLALYYVPLAVSVGIAMLASILVAFGWLPLALRGGAGRELDRRSRSQTVGPRRGAALLARWCGALAAAVVLATLAMAVPGRIGTLLDHWPWAVGIVVLLLAVGAMVSFIESLTAFHLRFWWLPVALTVAVFAGTVYVYRNYIHEGGFWRPVDEERLILYLERPLGTDVVLASESMKRFEAELLPVPDGVHMKSWSLDNRAYMEIKFDPDCLRSVYPDLFRSKLILLAEEMGGMFIWIAGFGEPYMRGGGGGGALSNSLIKITGYNSKTLDGIGAGVMERLARNRRVRNARLTSGARFERVSADETVIHLDRDELNAHDLTVAQVAQHLQRLLGIDTPWHMVVSGEDRRLQLAFEESAAIQADRILQKTIATPNGHEVALAKLVSIETRPMIASISRENQRYSMQINWEFIGPDRMRHRYISTIVAGLALPYGYSAEDVSGQQVTEEEEEAMTQMLWLTLLFIYMTLAALFESFSLPFLVLLAVPMALSGVVGIFWITDSDFDSSAKIGLVLLFGIVVNNAILLVNRYRLRVRELVAERADRASSMPSKPRPGGVDLWRLPADERRRLLATAIGSGTRIQLRSILLTSGTTVAGLLPLLIRLTETTQGKDIWENLALSSIGGLVSSTLLIITAIPALYWVTTRVGWSLAGLHDRLRRRGVAAKPALQTDG